MIEPSGCATTYEALQSAGIYHPSMLRQKGPQGRLWPARASAGTQAGAAAFQFNMWVPDYLEVHVS